MKKLTFILIVLSLNLSAQFKVPTYSNSVKGTNEFSPEVAFAFTGLGATVFINSMAMNNDLNLNKPVHEQNQITLKNYTVGVVGSFAGYYIIKYIRKHKPFKKKRYKYKHKY